MPAFLAFAEPPPLPSVDGGWGIEMAQKAAVTTPPRSGGKRRGWKRNGTFCFGGGPPPIATDPGRPEVPDQHVDLLFFDQLAGIAGWKPTDRRHRPSGFSPDLMGPSMVSR